MSKWLLRGFFSTLKWALCAVGAGALLLTALIATPLTRPPELHSLSASRGTIGSEPPGTPAVLVAVALAGVSFVSMT